MNSRYLFVIILLTANLFGMSWQKTIAKNWWDEAWIKPTDSEQKVHKELTTLLNIVASTKRGRELLYAARVQGFSMEESISVADISITETTFSRSFSLDTAKEKLETATSIQLSRHLSRMDAIYDLSHELTHLSFRKPVNPYKFKVNANQFIQRGIEGVGGELNAFESECLVAYELEKRAGVPEHRLCKKYKLSHDSFNKTLAKKDYYAVGGYLGRLSHLAPHFPLLSSNAVVFSSSLEKMPYPMALLKEFRHTRKMACRNNLRKSKLIALHMKNEGRSIQSIAYGLRQEQSRLRAYQKNHCSRLK